MLFALYVNELETNMHAYVLRDRLTSLFARSCPEADGRSYGRVSQHPEVSAGTPNTG